MLRDKSSRAAILVDSGQPLIIDKFTFPADLKCGQVLVKVCYSGICGSQIGEIDALKGEDQYLPHLLGHEGSGIVLATGPGVKHVKVDDHVVMHWRKGVGIDAPTPVYSWKGKRLNAGYVTTFNEYAIVSENRLTAIPHSFNLQLAPLFGCAITTGLGVIGNNANLKIGQSIVVFGAGGVGLNEIQGATMTSAYPIVAVDLYDSKLELAKKMGATNVINSKSEMDIKDEIFKIVGIKGADVVIDNTGNTSVIALAYELTQPCGRTILVGVPKNDDNISIYSLPLHFGKIITGSHGGESDPSVDIPRFIRLHEAGKLQLDDLITDRFTLDEINKAILKMRKGEISGRCLVDMNS